jgi:hypothetical protein
LFDEVRRAKNREGFDLATVDEFAQDESGFDGFTDTNVIGDEKTWHLKTQRHEERDELIDARLERKLGGGTKRAGTATERETQGIREQSGLGLHSDTSVGREIEAGWLDRAEFQSWIEESGIGLRSREGAELEKMLLRCGHGDPFAATGANKVSW